MTCHTKLCNDHITPAKSRAQPFPAQTVNNDGSTDVQRNQNEEVVLYHIKFTFWLQNIQLQ